MIDPAVAEDICSNFRLLGPIALALLAFVLPFGQKHLKPLEKAFNKIAVRKNLALLLLGLTTFISAALVSFIFSWPIPNSTDEFSYLLAADTFAHGRLTNPTHPMWVHFESFHILQQPSYMSKYPPAQAVFLAIGQVLTGYPIVGVWFSIALACVALCWMLQAYIPPRWALLGGVLMMLKLALFSYWGQSFWGGAVAAIGGALLFGALRRIIKRAAISYSLLFGLGLALLANSRPYEGAILGLLTIGVLAFWILSKKSPAFSVVLPKVILPLGACIVLLALIMGVYNSAVTGKAWLLPYQLHKQTVYNLPIFIWEKPGAMLSYNHVEFYNSYLMDLAIYNSQKDFSTFISVALVKLKQLWDFFIGISFTLPLLALPFVLKNRWIMFAFLSYLALLVGLLQTIFFYPHYAAPGICLLYLLVMQCLRRIYIFRLQKKPVGKLLVWSVPLYTAILVLLPMVLNVDPYMQVNPSFWQLPHSIFTGWSVKRELILSKLKAEEGNHLVIVKYLPGHNYENEWVYNGANIDKSKVIWARSMSFEKDCELIKYFHDRKIWLLQIESEPTVIKSFSQIKGCE